MSLSTHDEYVTAFAQRRQNLRFVKASIANMVAGNLCSLWRATGYPAQPAIPGAAAAVDDSSSGANPFVNPGGGRTMYLALAEGTCTLAESVRVFDRVIQMGGLSGTSVASQAVTTPALPARCDSNGADVRWFVECYTDLGATPRTLTVTYTNQAGTGSRTTTVSIPATMRAGHLLEILPANGDTSIRSVESVQLSGSTGTAGDVGVTAAREKPGARLSSLVAGLAARRSGLEMGLPIVANDECLWLVVDCTTTSTGIVDVNLSICEG
jgi:hypothetical protein